MKWTQLCRSIPGDADLHRSDAVDDVLLISPLIAAAGSIFIFCLKLLFCWFNQLNEGPISLCSCPEKPKKFPMKSALRKSVRSADWGQGGSELDDLFWRLGKEQDWKRRIHRQTLWTRSRTIPPWIWRSVIHSFSISLLSTYYRLYSMVGSRNIQDIDPALTEFSMRWEDRYWSNDLIEKSCVLWKVSRSTLRTTGRNLREVISIGSSKTQLFIC